MKDSQTQPSLNRARDCFIKRRALEMWLGILTPLRWFTVVGTILFSSLAAATFLGSGQLLGSRFTAMAGFSALIATVLSGLHTGLNCDAYQAECTRLTHAYERLQASFEDARQLAPEARKKREAELEQRYEQTIESTTVRIPLRFRERSERQAAAFN